MGFYNLGLVQPILLTQERIGQKRVNPPIETEHPLILLH
jgi:hypothetical protein